MNNASAARQNAQNGNPQQSRKRALLVFVCLALLVCLATGGFFIWKEARIPAYDAAAQQTQGADLTYEDLVAELDKTATESRLWISVASSMTADSQTGAITAINALGQPINVLDNIQENSRDIAYSFALDDGSVIYESDLIKPGQSIESPVLNVRLSPGAYDVTVTAQGYDVESHNAVGGTVAAKATLNVE